MDCDKFDNVLMDLLYEELDELTRASAQRHADQCQRCRDTLAGFKATREVGAMPLVEPPEGFEARVLEAERVARRDLPVHARVMRALTILSGYAMRPQLAMAALLLLVIGTSLALLRPEPGSHGSVHVTEHGAPEAEKELVVPLDEPVEVAERAASEEEATKPPAEEEVPSPDQANSAVVAGLTAPSAEPPELDEVDDRARAEAEDRAYADAMQAYRAGNYTVALEQFDAIVQSGGRNALAAELYGAFSTQKAIGCAAALPRFDSVAAHSAHNDLGHQAIWQSATCRAQVGELARARLDFEKLLQVSAYAQRARQALVQMGDEGDTSMLANRRSKKSADTKPEASAQAEGEAESSEPVAAKRPAAKAKAAPPRTRSGKKPAPKKSKKRKFASPSALEGQ